MAKVTPNNVMTLTARKLSAGNMKAVDIEFNRVLQPFRVPGSGVEKTYDAATKEQEFVTLVSQENSMSAASALRSAGFTAVETKRLRED